MTPAPEESILTEYVDTQRDVQTHIWNDERRKARNKVWSAAAIFLIGDLVTLSMANVLNSQTLVASLVIPMILFGLGFWALANPMPAVITVSVLIVAIFAYQFYLIGWGSLLAGFIAKGALIYVLFAAWSNARHAQAARRQLA